MSIVNPNDPVERQNEKLLVIARSLMRRVEQKNDQSGLAYQQFERAALLETQVRPVSYTHLTLPTIYSV